MGGGGGAGAALAALGAALEALAAPRAAGARGAGSRGATLAGAVAAGGGGGGAFSHPSARHARASQGLSAMGTMVAPPPRAPQAIIARVRLPFALLIALLPLLPVAGPSGSAPSQPQPETRAPAVSLAPEIVPARPVARIVETLPRGERVPVDEPVVVRFSDQGDPPKLRNLEVSPKTEGTLSWPTPRTLVFRPKSWRVGHAQRVRVDVGSERFEWVFRTEVPEPLEITPGEGKRIVLTFDDGPHDRRQADSLLNVLKKRGATAIFFPTGRWVKQRPDWLRRAVKEGHRVCNHTFSHRNLTKPPMTEEMIRFEIENGASDGSCKLFRPPLMAVDDRVLRIVKELGYEMFLWDVDSKDWQDTPAVDVENFVLGQAQPDAVVLLHIHARGTQEALPSLVERLMKAGYRVSHVPAQGEPDVGLGGSHARQADLAAFADTLLD